MNKVLLVFTLLVGLLSCSGKSNEPREATASASTLEVKDHVEVIYFHGKQRCITCRAIETLSKEVVDSLISAGVPADRLNFKVVDIDREEALADSYEVAGSSLFLVKYNNGREARENLTAFGFSTAKNKPGVFKHGLAERIEGALK